MRAILSSWWTPLRVTTNANECWPRLVPTVSWKPSDAWSSATGFRFVGTDPSSARTRGHAAAVVKLTSGSTGSPRAVAMPTDALLADEDALASTMGLHDGDRLWSAVPFSHWYGFTTLALSAMVRGLTLVVPADLEPFSSLGAARKLGVTVFPTVPAYVQALLRLPTVSIWPESIRLVIAAGALLPAETALHFRRVHKQAVHTFYGSSECGGICYDRDGGAAERGTVGTPVRGVRLSLAPLDSSTEEGLVVVESPSVGDTYLPDADRRLGLGRFETNDVGAWRGGELTLLRRVDRVINVRGRKVDPCEVEAVLSMLEGVTEVVVVGVSSPDGSDEIVRAVMACPSIRPEYREIAAWCRGRLADHKVPRSVVFVDSIPRTLRGKIDRQALLKLDGAKLAAGQSLD